MSAPRPDAITLIAEVTAKHVSGMSSDSDECGLSFWLDDGEVAVDIRHDIGDQLEAAAALDRLADAIRAHAKLIRQREQMLHHGPLTGPVPWPQR